MEETTEKKTKHFLSKIGGKFLSFLLCLMVAYGCARFITDFFIQPIHVDGVSMENTLFQNDVLLVDKISYRFHDPERFDVVIFPYSMREYYVKRVIGLPGETLQIMNGTIYIDGEPLLEGYGEEEIVDPGIAENPITLGADEYFLMGDNRNHSTDSRNILIGPVERKRLEGRAVCRIYPFDSMRIFY